MKIILFLTLLCNVASAAAQCYPLMGKVTGNDGRAAAGAVITARHKGKTVTATADQDGLYSTALLPAGRYRLTISAGRITGKGRVVLHAPQGCRQSFCYFSLKGKQVSITESTEDPFMETALSKVKAAPALFDLLQLSQVQRAQPGKDVPVPGIRRSELVRIPAGSSRLNYDILDKVKAAPALYDYLQPAHQVKMRDIIPGGH